MNIININVTCGPNYWSVKWHRLVVMQLDLKELETQPTNEIKKFYRRLKKAIPSLHDHYCSEGVPGGFFNRVKRGTWMGHVIEHIALEIQIIAGIKVGFGRTRGTGTKGQYNVIFECTDENTGRIAAEKSVTIAQALIDGSPAKIKKHVNEIRLNSLKNLPGPSTSSLLREAAARNIPSIRLEDNSTYQLGYGKFQEKITGTIASTTSSLAVDLACNKVACRNLFKEMSIPVAEGDVVYSKDDLKLILNDIGFPVIVKPVNGNQGRGVTTNINSWEEAVNAFKYASKISDGVIVERHIPGNDYRLLTVNYKFVAAAKRTAAHVVGDGKSTVKQLIHLVNRDSCRGDGHDKILTKITINPTVKEILSRNGYSLNTILSKNEILYLDYAANLSKGGTAEDVTGKVHPDIIKMSERISKISGMDICGIDIMASTLEQPLQVTGGVVLEINAAPGFRMHLSPLSGEKRNVAAPVLDMLFPPGAKSRIPIIAVTGTNGKTTTTRLVSHIMKVCGRHVGSTTTDGIYLNDVLLRNGDCGGPGSAEIILREPTVDLAVLECARGGLLRSGLGFDQCDVAVVTNVTSDHLGSNGINDLNQMAALKAVVPESVHHSGYAVLNADDERVYSMRNNLKCKVVLFSMNPDNPYLKAHGDAGGICVIYKDRRVIICDENVIHIIEKVENIPLCFGGRAGFMIENTLAAVAAAYTQNITPAEIRESLISFEPSPIQSPGRMNLFSFENFDVLIDYAHNPAGMLAIKKFLDNSSYRYKVGIVCGIGDRRKEDNLEVGRISAEIFDKIIIREDSDLRGKAGGETTKIIIQGIARSPHNPEVITIPNEKKAVIYAINNASAGTLIMLCVEKIDEILDLMKEQMSIHNKHKSPVLNMHYDNEVSADISV